MYMYRTAVLSWPVRDAERPTTAQQKKSCRSFPADCSFTMLEIPTAFRWAAAQSRSGYDGPVSATARGGDADKGVSQAQRPAAPLWLGRLPCSGPPIGPARGAAADTAEQPAASGDLG